MPPDDIQQLRHVIEESECCETRYVGTVRITERDRSETVFDGVVEIFALTNHPTAQICYAWGCEEDGNLHPTVVLKVPPVANAKDAVRMAIAAKG